jgi:glucosamine--fructose-6-phosphate aminotransferase (isomerizing)
MCGIAGFSLVKKDHINGRALSDALLAGIVQRGTDATGAAWTDRSAKRIRVRKAAKHAAKFRATSLMAMDESVQTAVLHTRYATKGSPSNNGNNHPIIVRPIIGVHNGVITNDDDLYLTLLEDRQAEVDSEAAFALLAQYDEPATDMLGMLEGRVALAWLDTRNADRLHLARLEGSPLAVGQTRHGSVIFASTMTLLMAAVRRERIALDWAQDVEEQTYMTATHGRINDCLEVPVAPRLEAAATLW